MSGSVFYWQTWFLESQSLCDRNITPSPHPHSLMDHPHSTTVLRARIASDDPDIALFDALLVCYDVYSRILAAEWFSSAWRGSTRKQIKHITLALSDMLMTFEIDDHARRRDHIRGIIRRAKLFNTHVVHWVRARPRALPAMVTAIRQHKIVVGAAWRTVLHTLY